MKMNNKKYFLILLFGFLAFLPLIPFMSRSREMRCIFCDIINNKTQATILVDTEEYVILKDIRPASTHHYLAISKRHIESLKALTKEDDSLVVHMEAGLKEFFKKDGIDTNDALFGFHLPPFISVKHLHMHGISPRSTMSFFSRVMFRPGSAWFKTVEEARAYIAQKV